MGCVNTTTSQLESVKRAPPGDLRLDSFHKESQLTFAIKLDRDPVSITTRDMQNDEDTEFADHAAKPGYAQTVPQFSPCSMTAVNRVKPGLAMNQLDIVEERMYRCEAKFLQQSRNTDFDDFDGNFELNQKL